MMHVLRSLVVLFCILHTTAYAQKKRAPEEPFFPLMAWDDVRDEATIKKMADCGINSIAFVPPKLLDACAKYGVKAIIYDERILPAYYEAYSAERANPVLRELIKKYNNHPALFGYHLKDEPGAGEYGELSKSVKLVNELAPGRWPYINLLPAVDDHYDNYVKSFMETCKPMYLSFDRYAIADADPYGFAPAYWTDLSLIRKNALAYNTPFHTILLTAAHFNYRVPTLDDLSLQIYGALAYGTRGLAFYKFIGESLSIMKAPDLGNWRMAPLDEFHRITPGYYNLQLLISRVKTMAPILLNLKSDDVYHIAGEDIPPLNHKPGPSNLIQAIEGHSFIVGEFTHVKDQSKWIMVVNRNLKQSAFLRPKYSEQVDPASVEVFSQATGKMEKITGFYALSPGQGALLRVKLKK